MPDELELPSYERRLTVCVEALYLLLQGSTSITLAPRLQTLLGFVLFALCAFTFCLIALCAAAPRVDPSHLKLRSYGFYSDVGRAVANFLRSGR